MVHVRSIKSSTERRGETSSVAQTESVVQSRATETHVSSSMIETAVAETQTQIAGIDRLLAFSEPIQYEEITTLPLEINEQIVRELYTPGSNLVCCKCGKDGSNEELCKCNATGLRTLRENCTVLGLEDLLKTIETQWNSQRLRIHKSCRTSLYNQSTAFLKQREF